jgi:3-oxoacyl-[acyl-carrier-protein] synthase II
MRDSREVLITGAGVVSPLGLGIDSYWTALRSGRSAVHEESLSHPVDERHWYVSKVDGFDAKKYVQPRKTIKLICEEIQFAFGAAAMACEQAGIQTGTVDPDRLAVCFGGEMIYSEVQEVNGLVRLCSDGDKIDYRKWAPPFMSNIYPLWMLKSLPNMAACHIGISLDARGPVNTITTDETSALMAIHEAFLLLQRGAADVVVVGSCSSYINPTRSLQIPIEHYATHSTANPETIVKPFDKNRVGMARGQGAACLILESADHAAARNAKPLGKLKSVASGFRKPVIFRGGSADSLSATLQLAIDRAGINSTEIDHVNTGAGGAVLIDAAFANGVAAVDKSLPVVAVQGGMGNLGVATGLCELVASIAAAANGGLSPHTVNFCEPDPALCGKVQAEPGRAMVRPYMAKVSQTPHGQSAAAVVQLMDL